MQNSELISWRDLVAHLDESVKTFGTNVDHCHANALRMVSYFHRQRYQDTLPKEDNNCLLDRMETERQGSTIDKAIQKHLDKSLITPPSNSRQFLSVSNQLLRAPLPKNESVGAMALCSFSFNSQLELKWQGTSINRKEIQLNRPSNNLQDEQLMNKIRKYLDNCELNEQCFIFQILRLQIQLPISDSVKQSETHQKQGQEAALSQNTYNDEEYFQVMLDRPWDNQQQGLGGFDGQTIDNNDNRTISESSVSNQQGSMMLNNQLMMVTTAFGSNLRKLQPIEVEKQVTNNGVITLNTSNDNPNPNPKAQPSTVLSPLSCLGLFMNSTSSNTSYFPLVSLYQKHVLETQIGGKKKKKDKPKRKNKSKNSIHHQSVTSTTSYEEPQSTNQTRKSNQMYAERKNQIVGNNENNVISGKNGNNGISGNNGTPLSFNSTRGLIALIESRIKNESIQQSEALGGLSMKEVIQQSRRYNHSMSNHGHPLDVFSAFLHAAHRQNRLIVSEPLRIV